jgi:hypothetical protein
VYNYSVGFTDLMPSGMVMCLSGTSSTFCTKLKSPSKLTFVNSLFIKAVSKRCGRIINLYINKQGLVREQI